VAFASTDAVIHLWNLLENKEIAAVKLGSHKIQNTIELVHWKNELFLLSGGVDATIHLYRIKENRFLSLLKVKGHENWIKSIRCHPNTHKTEDGEEFRYIASSDQDGYIRIWKFKYASAAFQKEKSSFEFEGFENASHSFVVDGTGEFTFLIDSVIEAHEDWVSALDWYPQSESEDAKSADPDLKLLSCSMDQTMSIWSPDPESGIWLNAVQVGQVGGHGTKLGLVHCAWSPDGKSILASSFNGSFHHWNLSQDDEDFSWKPTLSPSGHFDSIADANWNNSVPGSPFLLTVSKDQTTRAFASIKGSRSESRESWCEISRPQVHGYDMSCITSLSSFPFRFVSGAEEKVLRVFDAPSFFLNALSSISGTLISEEDFRAAKEISSKVILPELGLSNKATFSANDGDAEELGGAEDTDDGLKSSVVEGFDSPPLEEDLIGSTLFPEVNKLYGHGYEIYSVASSHRGHVVASACVAKSSQGDHAAIILWDTSSWKEIGRLNGHTLTVTQMEFSHNDKFLLSVSRDRQVCVFDVADLSTPKLVKSLKAHSRIVWSCSFSEDDELFATASRDKTVKIWRSSDWSLVSTLSVFADSVTAIAFAPLHSGNVYRFAVGLESGLLYFYEGNADKGFSQIGQVLERDCHFGPISRLSWTIKDSRHLLASVGEDHSVRIHSVLFD
jgi:elongator complex protein 2